MDITKQTYTELIVDYVKKSILNGTYNPGTKVKELEIAKHLSISRAPIREALQILIKEGLIVWIPQKGKFINQLDTKGIRNSYFTGGVLEAAAVAANIASYTKGDIARLEKIVSKMNEIDTRKGTIDEVIPLDDKFHKILFSRIDNELVVEVSKRCCQGVSRFLLYRHWIKLYSTREVYQRHLEILEVLKKGDKAELEHCIRQHYFESGERMARMIEASEQ